MWIVATVLGVAFFFIILIIILLAIPIDLLFYVEKDIDFRSRLRVQWMFGLIRKEISIKKKSTEREKKQRRIKSLLFSLINRGFSRIRIHKKNKKRKKRSIKPFLAMLRTRGFLGKLAKFIGRFFRILHIRELRINLRVGLDDPADTGLLFALIGPTMVFIRPLSSVDVQIEPDFQQENIQGRFQGDLRVFPIKFVKPLALFAFSITTLRAMKAMFTARRK